MLPGFGGYVYKKISLINIAPNLSFMKAAWCEIKLGLGAGWVMLSQWHEANKSHSSQASVTSKTISFPCHLTAATCADLPLFWFSQAICPDLIGGLHFRNWGHFWKGQSSPPCWWVLGHPLSRFRAQRNWLVMLRKNASESFYEILSTLLSLRHPMESSHVLTFLFWCSHWSLFGHGGRIRC